MDLETALILISLIVAYYEIHKNEVTSRKRATIDLVLHQRNDHRLTAAEKILRDLILTGDGLSKFACKDQLKSAETTAILEVLNQYEFIASGIKESAFDETIYKRMLKGVLIKDWKNLNGFITEIRNTRDHESLFVEFEWLAKKWNTN